MRGGTRIIKGLDQTVFLLLTLLLLAPLCWVVAEASQANADTWDQVWYRPFYMASANSLKILGGILPVVFSFGLLLGCLAGLYAFPLKLPGMIALGFPLLFPGFLIAIGVQSLQSNLSYANGIWVDGYRGCVWTGVVMCLPVVTVGTWLAVRKMNQAERDVMRLRGGWLRMLWMTLCRYAGKALGFAVLASFLFLSDFGVNQIMGFAGIAGDIQIAFSAKNDFGLAGAKALTVLICIAPVVWIASKAVMAALFPDAAAHAPRQGEPQDPGFWVGAILGAVFLVVCMAGPFLAGLGLLRPLFRSGGFRQLELAGDQFLNSLDVTLQYGLTGGLFAVFSALVVVLGLRRKERIVRSAAALGLLLMAIPSAVVALGVVKFSASVPWADAILRSEWVVGLGLGVRLAPLCVVVFLTLLWILPRSLSDVESITGMPRHVRKWKLDLSEITPAAMVMAMVAMILTLADVGAMVLMQPPGSASYGSLLFASMDNSPEQVVAAMCAVYGVLPLGLGMILLLMWGSILIFKRR